MRVAPSLRRWPCLAALALLGAACGGGGEKSAATTAETPAATTAAAPRPAAEIFGYDRSKPLDFRRGKVVNPGYPIPVRDVSYASPKGGRVTAFLGVPPVAGRRPAVIYLHGSGGSRVDLLLAATWMAARGAVVMTIDSAATRAGGVPSGLEGLMRQRDLEVQTVVDVRRAVDVLRSLPQVDPRRIAYVGWSAGAKTGATVAGVDHRIRAFDLIAGGALPVSAYLDAAPPELRPQLEQGLGEIDPLRYVGHAAPSRLFFQNGRDDEIVPRRALEQLFSVASEPKRIRWYPGGHAPSPAAYRDGLAWLSRQLGLGGPVVRGAKSGP